MVSNFYFNNFTNSQEQGLIEDLIIESIKIYGHDVYYCPRKIKNKDEIYGEDTVSEYNQAGLIEMYVKNYDSYEGDGTFLSKFNLEIRDQITLSVARRSFYNDVSDLNGGMDRPQEGDLIWSPMMNRLFVIKYVNNTSIYYQMGALQLWDVVCETFEYSSERLNTGIPDIDDIERKYSQNMSKYGLRTQGGDIIISQDGYDLIQGQYSIDVQSQDVFADNDELQVEGEDILDWSRIDPFSEGAV